MTIEDIITSSPVNMQSGLRWFCANAGKVVPWTKQLDDGTRLFSTPKGIYKPEGSEYALSVRQTLKSPYLDRDPIRRLNGTWTYMYFQEEDPLGGNDLYTNQALKRCMEDGIPVGVARQKSAKPDPTTYEILGIAKVTNWKDGFFQLDGYAQDGTIVAQPIEGPLAKELTDQESKESPESFDPTSQTDARDKVLREIVRRRGQRAFRSKLLRIYGGRCAITACSIEAILEAAHVTPYLGPDTNKAGNGMLLRADIHTLWDLGLVAINPASMTLWVSPNLVGSEYEIFNGTTPFAPQNPENRPSIEALKAQWTLAQNAA
ncbi:MAG: HNH endonuclease [Thiobacillus sp.]